MTLADIRREYALGSLRRADLNPDPLAQFQGWMETALNQRAGRGRWRRVAIGLYKWFQLLLGHTPFEPTAMTLATADAHGRPAARTVLLKGVDARGFIFYSHYAGPKGHDLAENPRAALVFYWPDLERQVCISGVVSRLPREESEAYFRSRPRGSRLAVWVSPQSAVVESRKWLETKFQEVTERFRGQDVPMPDYWGGYVLAPDRIEFWQGRQNRLHDRLLYTKQADGTWRIERLAP